MTTRMSAAEVKVLTSRETGAVKTYEGIRLDTNDPDKLVPFVDQLLFFLRASRSRTRPLAIEESKGVAAIQLSRHTPRKFRAGRQVLCISEGQHMDCFSLVD